MRTILITTAVGIFITLTLGCNRKNDQHQNPIPIADSIEKQHISTMLDSFNVAAAKADYNKYFEYFADNATFNGTDASENWDKKSFMIWAKPHFENGNTWNFKSIQRNIYFGKSPDLAWFDELLSTQMKICRGSGVLVKKNGRWKVQQYVLSLTIPNRQLDKVIPYKLADDDSLINELTKIKR